MVWLAFMSVLPSFSDTVGANDQNGQWYYLVAVISDLQTCGCLIKLVIVGVELLTCSDKTIIVTLGCLTSV